MKKKISLVKTFLFILALVSLGFVLFGLNKPHIKPIAKSAELITPSAIGKTDTGYVVCDTLSTRLLFLNEDFEVYKISSLLSAGSPIDKVNNVIIAGNHIYALGSMSVNNGLYLKSESVVEYSSSGSYERTLYSADYPDDVYVTKNQFLDLIIYEGSLYLLKCDDNTISSVNLDSGEEIISAPINHSVIEANFTTSPKLIAICNVANQLTWIDYADCTEKPVNYSLLFDIPENGSDHTISESENAFYAAYRSGEWNFKHGVINWDGDTPVESYIIDQSSHNISHTTSDNFEGEMITAVSFSLSYFFSHYLFWLSVLYLGSFVLYFLIKLLIKKAFWKSGSYMIIMLLVSLAITFFFTTNNKNQLKEECERDLFVQCLQTALNIEKNESDFLDFLHVVPGKEELTEDEIYQIDHMTDYLKEITIINGKEMAFFASIYYPSEGVSQIDDNDSISLLYCCDSLDSEPRGTQNTYFSTSLTNTVNAGNDCYFFEYITKDKASLSCYHPLHLSTGEIVGFLEIGCDRQNLLNVQNNIALNMVLTLMCIFIVIYVSFKTYLAFKSDLKDYIMRKKEKAPGAQSSLSGIFYFTINIIFSLDSVILVFVTKELCGDMEPAKMAAMTAIPLTAYNLGQWLGTIVSPFFFKRISEKLIAIISCIFSIGAMFMMVMSLGLHSIILFSAAKLITGIFLSGILFILGKRLPLSAPTKELQEKSLHSNYISSISASVIGMLAGGYLSQYLSYSSIYIFAAILVGLLLFIAIFAFPKKENAAVTETAAVKSSPWRVFTDPQMYIFIIFYALPVELLGGYRSYLFPLYSAGAGLSSILLSNINVFSKTIAFLANNSVRKFVKSHDSIKLMYGANLGICAALICFLLSPNIWWAIITLFIISILGGFTSVGSGMYLSGIAERNGSTGKEVFPCYQIVGSGISSAKSAILSVFLKLGNNLACAGVGTACGSLLVVFAICAEKFRKKVKKN